MVCKVRKIELESSGRTTDSPLYNLDTPLQPLKGGVPKEIHGFPLGGSWVVISRVISRVTILISHIRGLMPPLITAQLTPKP